MPAKPANYRDIRCDGEIHRKHPGRLLIVYDRDALYVKCPDRGCRCWTRIKIHLPGARVNLFDAGLTQETLTADYGFDVETAPTIRARVCHARRKR